MKCSYYVDIVGRPVLPHSSLSCELAATQNRLTSIYGFSSRATLQGLEPTWTHVSGENIDTEQPERNYVHQKKKKKNYLKYIENLPHLLVGLI